MEDAAEHVQEVFFQPPVWDRLVGRMWRRRVRHNALKKMARPTKRDPRDDVPCPECGKTFDKRRTGWLRKYCSDICRSRKFWKRPPPTPKPSRPCVGCQTPIIPRPTGGKPQKWCSTKCQSKHRSLR